MQSIRKAVYAICCLVLLTGCTAGRTAFNKAEELEREGRLDEAFLKYAEVSMANPDISEYRLRFINVGEKAAQIHLKKADEFMAAKKYDKARQEYQAASLLDPSLERAKQKSAEALKLRDSSVYLKEGNNLEKKQKLSEAYRAYRKSLEFNPDNRDAKEGIKRISQSRKTKIDGFELNIKSNKPITLKFRNTRITDVFAIVTRLSGINFIFDEAVKDQNFSIFLEDATFEQALDIITNMNRLGRKVLNENTIIVYPKTPEKMKQYEELVVKTIFLNNLDAKKAINLLRTMLQIKKVYVNEELNAIVIRDVAATVDVAQKILEANDLSDAEVLLEVEVIEVKKTDQESFGLTLSQYGVTFGAGEGGNLYLDTLGGTAQSTENLAQVFSWNGTGGFITVPNATYNFGKTLANAEVLANPKIRVKNREKSKFNVATREPITTISTTAGTTGYSTNVQYVDVGIKLNAEPIIQLNNEINLKLSLEVSSKLDEKTAPDGTTLITIGTRNVDTVLTLKDGETSVIGGLIASSTSSNKQKVFILSDIPIIGPLLTGTTNKKEKGELVLAITPRIVRLPSVPEGDHASFWSGKEDEPSTTSPYSSFSPEPDTEQGNKTIPAKSSGTPVPFETIQQPPAPAHAPVQQAPGQPAVSGTLSITAPPAVSFGEQFSIEVKSAGFTNLYGAPFVLMYDPGLVDLVGVAEGNFLKQDGRGTEFRTSVDGSSGKIAVAMSRVGGSGGVSGSGTLINALFKSRKKGLAGFAVQDANFSTVDGSPIQTYPYNVAVEIR